MKMNSQPIIKDVVLVGAGHAHVGVLRAFGMKPLPGVRFTLITRELDTPYSGMLPGLIAGHYGFEETHIDTGPLARFAGARLYHDVALGLDLESRQVICRDRPPVPYDILSLDIGSTPNTGGVPGAAEHAIPVKPIDGFLPRFEAMLGRVLARRGRSRIALVGAGPGGVEMLLSIERRLRSEVAAAGHDAAALGFVLVSGTGDILPTLPEGVRARARRIFAERGIAIVAGSRVTRVEAGFVHVQGGEPIAADEVLWTTEATAAPWLGGTGLVLDERGFVRTDGHLRAIGREDVYAAGDVSAFDPRPLRKAGVYAVRAGKVLAENIRRTLTGRSLRAFKPQRDALYLITTGERHAIGTRNGFVVEGGWVWRWKDLIDRRFMARFNQLPDMPAPSAGPASPLADRAAVQEISAVAMRCGGCGAKVGATTLTRALGRLDPLWREDVVVGLDSPDDAAIVDAGGPRLLVQSVDYFRSIVDDPYIFGRIAANHALGDIFAMGGEPQTALAIATVPYGLEAKVEADLGAMMEGANQVLREAGCALVGGHTSEGAELALGFAVNGLVARKAHLGKGGLTPGDALILTKPIGTGTLLAADMRGLARASWVAAGAPAHDAIEPGRGRDPPAARGPRRDRRHRLRPSRTSRRDDPRERRRRDALARPRPLAGGSQGERGARRVLLASTPERPPAPRHSRPRARGRRPPLPAPVRSPDSRGLLASVPAEQAAACLRALRAGGYPAAAIVGRVGAPTEALAPIVLSRAGDEPDPDFHQFAGGAGSAPAWTQTFGGPRCARTRFMTRGSR
jgi:selenide,water dikinase